MKPRINFVLPTYNRIAWLGECIESLRKQQMKDIEIIVVDDCSTDTTEDLMNWYLKQDNRIKYVKNKVNLGAGLSRNVGNKMATSDIICVCDSDDYYPDYRADFTFNYFKKNRDVDVVNSSYYRVNYSNKITHEFKSEKFKNEDFQEKKPFYFCHPSCAYRKSLAMKIPYKKELKDKTDDFQFIEDLVKHKKKICNVEKILCYHRVLPGSIMANMRGGSLE